MENNPLRGLFGVSSPRPELQLIAPQPTAPTENIEYEIPSGMIEQLLANPYAGDGTVVDHQRRLNPKMKEVVRTEILKLLAAGIIYPIADSRWVSPIHCVPKKGGINVVPSDKNELIPQRIVTVYRMVIDFRK